MSITNRDEALDTLRESIASMTGLRRKLDVLQEKAARDKMHLVDVDASHLEDLVKQASATLHQLALIGDFLRKEPR